MADLSNTKVVSITGTSGAKRKRVSAESQGLLNELFVYHNGDLYMPPVLDDVTWTTERKGSPSSISFKVFQDGNFKFDYGDIVIFKYNSNDVFYGYLFESKPSKDRIIEFKAYDQLRYLKNKHTYIYSKKRLDQVVKMVSQDFKLNVGSIAKTDCMISRVEDNQTLFDIIQNAVDDTLMATSKLYVLYDEFGRLNLKNIADMKVDHVIDQETAQNYSYTVSIDGNTFNRVQTYIDNDGVRSFYVAQDGENQSKWGVLQLTQKASSSSTAKQEAKALLNSYNMPARKLTVEGAFGNVSVRAGSLVPVFLKLEDMEISNYMLVEKAVHKFAEGEDTMNLTLSGNNFGG